MIYRLEQHKTVVTYFSIYKETSHLHKLKNGMSNWANELQNSE